MCVCVCVCFPDLWCVCVCVCFLFYRLHGRDDSHHGHQRDGVNEGCLVIVLQQPLLHVFIPPPNIDFYLVYFHADII